MIVSAGALQALAELGSGHPDHAMRGPVKHPAARTTVGYHPPVCSNLGDAIYRITAAIDQLARDAKDSGGDQELTARVADLWQQVSGLDPELARRAQAYKAQADGAPPA